MQKHKLNKLMGMLHHRQETLGEPPSGKDIGVCEVTKRVY